MMEYPIGLLNFHPHLRSDIFLGLIMGKPPVLLRTTRPRILNRVASIELADIPPI
jgi:hypothetical protein